MRLVQDQQADTAQELASPVIVRVVHQPGVCHVGGHKNDSRRCENLGTLFRRHAAIDKADADAERVEQAVPLVELVLDERFGRIERHDPGKAVTKQDVQAGGHEDQALTRRRGGRQTDVFTAGHGRKCLRLV